MVGKVILNHYQWQALDGIRAYFDERCLTPDRLDVVGSQIIMTAGFSGADSLQWKRNGTNILGATASTLTLNNLQLTNAGAYPLVASNAIGFNQLPPPAR